MTKEELEKRAFAEADKVVIGKEMDKRAVVHLRHLLKNMYVNGAISETELLSQRIAELEAQNEKMKCCQNCDNWNWKHNKCEKKLKGDCFKASKWILRR